MARERINTSNAAIAEPEESTSGEQGNMFPDLDKGKPEEKKLITFARSWIRIVDERKAALDEAKTKEDEAHEKMVEQAKALKIERFNIAGREITIEHKDKAKMKASKVEKSDDEGGDAE